MSIFDFYTIFFKIIGTFGIMTFETDKETHSVKPVNSGGSYYFSIFNMCVVTAVTLKQGVTLGANLMAPDTVSKEIELCFQVIYFSGTAMIVAIAVNPMIYSKEIAHLFTALIQLDKYIDEDPTPQMIKEKNSWMKIRLFQVKVIPYAFTAAALFNFSMYYFLPRFPHFIWFMVPPLSETEESVPEYKMWSSELFRVLIGLPDVWMVPIGWVYLIGMDLILGIVSSQIAYYLKVLKIKSEEMNLEDVKAYNSLCIIMSIINDALAMGLIVHKALMSCVILFMLYGIIHGTTIIAVLFYVSNVSGFIIRIIYLLIPVAKLQTKSSHLVKHMKEAAPPKIRRETLPMRDFCLSAGGIYKIDMECVFHFFNFLISYFVLMSSS